MAVFKQDRYVELIGGSTESFVITNEMYSASIPAELPHLNVFVLQVIDVTDPKQDVLSRVASLADLTTTPIGRDAGISSPTSSGTFYLSTTVTVKYATIETANDAAKAFRDRVSALVSSWTSYDTTFVAHPVPATYILPLVDTSQLTALINTYTIAKQDRYQKQIAKADADAALLRAQNDYTYKQSLLPNAIVVTNGAIQVQTNLGTVITQFAALKSAGDTFYNNNLAGTGAPAFKSALDLAGTQYGSMPGYNTNAANHYSDASNYQAARQTDVNNSATSLATAQSTQITATQALTSAQATEVAALNAVYAVCPDFDKHSIPFVPDTEP